MEDLNVKDICTAADVKARIAVEGYIGKYGEPYYCGFAWVSVPVERTNSKLAKELMEVGFTKGWEPKTVVLWGASNYNGQSMDVKEIFAEAYASYLTARNIKAYWASRAD